MALVNNLWGATPRILVEMAKGRNRLDSESELCCVLSSNQDLTNWKQKYCETGALFKQ
jgi:hypothetical protein